MNLYPNTVAKTFQVFGNLEWLVETRKVFRLNSKRGPALSPALERNHFDVLIKVASQSYYPLVYLFIRS